MSETATKDETSPEAISFKAEIKQILDILIHSLYTDRAIFLRELISNASDALNRMRFELLTNREVHDPDADLEIRIENDPEAHIIRIIDSGIGMNQEEITQNLGTIAQSGARAFVQAAKDQEKDLSDIIGQFGVGFYSTFMVAEWVRVTSRSYRPVDKAVMWYSVGDQTFTVSPAQKESRGTIVEVKLKEDATEFAESYRLRETIRKHSDYVAFPIFLGDEEEQVNRQTALWRQSPTSVDEEAYEEFYKHLTLEVDPPLEHKHFLADAPIQVFALLFVPGKADRGMFSLRKEDGLKLYSRKVLIQEYTKELLPEYYRFIQGVVDSEDLPLNVSRQSVQVIPIMSRLKRILTNQVTGMLQDMASDKEHPGKYKDFWREFGDYIKEGIATDQDERENLYSLLRFHTTTYPEEWVSLPEYVGRMKPKQRKIYYILGDDQSSIIRSPHLDYFQRHSLEVILLTKTIDSFMLMGLSQYEGFDLQNVAAADLELPEVDEKSEETPEAISDEGFKELIDRFKEQLGDRVAEVRATERLSASIARLVDPEGAMNQEMQRVYKLMERDFETPKKVLELNPRHPTLSLLSELPPDDKRNELIIEQVYENALLIEGLHPDPASMLPRIDKLMEAALRR